MHVVAGSHIAYHTSSLQYGSCGNVACGESSTDWLAVSRCIAAQVSVAHYAEFASAIIGKCLAAVCC